MKKTDIAVIKKLFSGNQYITAAESPQYPPDKKLSRMKAAGFYFNFLRIVLDARKQVVNGIYSKDRLAESAYHVIYNLEKAGALFEINGLDNLRKEEGSVVIAGNHMSTLETSIFPCVIGVIKKSTYVVKRSLVTGFLFGPVMRFLEPIDVERKDPRKDLDAVLTKGKKLLDCGVSVVLFPQATRSKEFNPGEFNSLGIKLAKIAGVKIIPAALKTDMWENGKIISTCGNLYPGRKIYVEFGEPLAIDGAGRKEQERIVSYISEKIAGWQ